MSKNKIAAAATVYAKETWNNEEDQFVCMDGFKEGAQWMQHELLKSMWHDASEKPTRYDTYLVRTKQGCLDFCHFATEKWHGKGIGTVEKWLDLADIKPKGGNV